MKAFKHFTLLVSAATTLSLLSVAFAASPPDAASVKNQVERGRYLVMITGCNDCHTENFHAQGGKIPEAQRLTGSKVGWRGPWGTTYATNLRLYFNDLTEGQWLQLSREIQRRPPMPYYALNAMTDDDKRAIYQYIRSLGPAGAPAPAFVKAGIAPAGPHITYPMPAK